MEILFKESTTTHSVCRSLLQKCVRRGDSQLTDKLIHHLRDVGELPWLKKRAGVIIFEECWPLANDVSNINSFLQILTIASSSKKKKDAAGLGTLGFALSKGDESVLDHSYSDRHIRIVAEAIKRPDDFWKWAINSSNAASRPLVNNAYSFFKLGGWPWDLAFMQAAAYLAVAFGIPKNEPTGIKMEVPFWAGMDKHTSAGKLALTEVAKQVNCSRSLLFTISFYLESAVCNDMGESLWWDKEVAWSLSKFKVSMNDANEIWEKAKPLFINYLSEELIEFENHINCDSCSQNSLQL